MLVALEQRGKPRRANLSLLSPLPALLRQPFLALIPADCKKPVARVQENPRSLQSESLSNNFILEGHRKLNAHEL
jgi:hypothetical protein